MWGDLFNFVDINPVAGTIMWKHRPKSFFASDHEYGRWNTRYAHKPAFNTPNAKGYLCGSFQGKGFLAHRIVWRAYSGTCPKGEIDHINRNPCDNRICNLRDVSHLENIHNSGRWSAPPVSRVGVRLVGNRWIAEIGTGTPGQKGHLGSYFLFQDAVAARRKAEEILKRVPEGVE